MTLRSSESFQSGWVRDEDGRIVLGSQAAGEVSEGSGAAAVATSSTAVVTANDDRIELTIVNDSDTVVYLALGEAAVPNKGIRLNANGGSWTTQAFTGAVDGIHAGTGSKVVTYVEV